MSEVLSNITFNKKLKLIQEIIDTESGEVLFSVQSNVSLLSVKYFSLVLLNYIKFMRDGHFNLLVQIRSFYSSDACLEIPFDYPHPF